MIDAACPWGECLGEGSHFQKIWLKDMKLALKNKAKTTRLCFLSVGNAILFDRNTTSSLLSDLLFF